MTCEDLPGWFEFLSNTYGELQTANLDTSLASVVTLFWESIGRTTQHFSRWGLEKLFRVQRNCCQSKHRLVFSYVTVFLVVDFVICAGWRGFSRSNRMIVIAIRVLRFVRGLVMTRRCLRKYFRLMWRRAGSLVFVLSDMIRQFESEQLVLFRAFIK